MDGPDFDDLSRRVGNSLSRRRAFWSLGGVLGSLLPALPGVSVDARKKKRKKKKKKKGERCGPRRCRADQFCCDDASGTCCSKRGASCCNVGPGTGTCCAGPNKCGRPTDNDVAPQECCPPERQWFTTTGLVRCCPSGTRSLGTGVSSDGRCCPEEKYCSTEPTGGKCCADGTVCINPATGQCCSEANKCGSACCDPDYVCCNGNCEAIVRGPWTECGDHCCERGWTCDSDNLCTIE